MSDIDWEERAYQQDLYRMRYTTRAGRDHTHPNGINSEMRNGTPTGPHRVKNFPIKSWCKIAFTSDRVWVKRPDGAYLIREEPIDWLADRGFRQCHGNEHRDEWDTRVWRYGWKNNDSPPCGVFFFGDPDIALLFKLTWA